MNNKTRILLGIGLIITAIGIGYLLFRVFFASSPLIRPIPTTPDDQPRTTTSFPFGDQTDRTPGEDITPPTTLPPSETGPQFEDQPIVPTTPRVQTRFSGTAQSPALSGNGRLNFYNAGDGRFYRINADGEAEPLSDELFFSAESITWDDQAEKAIIEYPDGANIVYNFETKQQVTLPKHWEDFSFSNDGQKIAAKSIAVSPENRWLVTTDADGNNVELIEPLGENGDKVIVDWSANSQVVAFSRTGQALGLDRQEVLLVGQNGENFKSLIVEGRDFQPEWTPDGKKVLYSVYSERSDFRPELWITSASGDAIGSERTFLNINTWADKCAFGASDSRYVYCGVPESLERGAGFVPDVANQTADIIYRIDTTNGARTPLTSGQDDFLIVDSMSVDETNDRLFITDKRTNNIIEIDL
jgi:Tol biopolymer transport system component